jgi:hypothetical protein
MGDDELIGRKGKYKSPKVDFTTEGETGHHQWQERDIGSSLLP